MGYTPLAGLPMGSRSGDIDPSIIIKLLQGIDFNMGNFSLSSIYVHQCKVNILFSFLNPLIDLRKTTHEYVKCSFLDEGYSSEEVSDILHNKSGLYGISGKIYFLTQIIF